MIAPLLAAFIRRLLADKKTSRRKIAKIAGVSRTVVDAIARKNSLHQLPPLPNLDDDPLEPSGPSHRCPDCGGRVYGPCLLCLTRKQLAENTIKLRPKTQNYPTEPLTLNLRGEHLVRRNEILAARLAPSPLPLGEG